MKNDFLFDLIKSLDKLEQKSLKAFLKRYSSNYKNTNSLELLTALNKLKVFDKGLLRKHLLGKPVLKNLAYEKHKLLQSILSFLSDYTTKDIVVSKLYSHLKEAEVLLEKKLYELALVIIDKGFRLSNELKNASISYLFLIFKIKHASVFNLKKAERLVLINELEDYFQQMKLEAQYNTMYWDFVWHYLSNEFLEQQKQDRYFVKLEGNSLFKEEKLATNLKMKRVLYQTKFLYHYLKLDRDMGLFYSKKGIELLQSDPNYLKHSLNFYLVSCFNYINALFFAQEYQEIENVLAGLKKLPTLYKKELKGRAKQNYDSNYRLYLFRFFRSQYRYREVLEQLEADHKSIQNKSKALGVHLANEFYFDMINTNFSLGNYQQVIAFLNEFENKEDINSHAIIYMNSKILGIIAYYETEYWSVLDSQFDALYYYTRKMNVDDESIKFQVKIIRILLKNHDKMALEEILKSLEDSFRELEESFDIEDPFLIWYESKLAGMPIEDYVEKERLALLQKKGV